MDSGFKTSDEKTKKCDQPTLAGVIERSTDLVDRVPVGDGALAIIGLVANHIAIAIAPIFRALYPVPVRPSLLHIACGTAFGAAFDGNSGSGFDFGHGKHIQ
ncbi:MAG: hypothetical protein JO142_05615 [Burkholderiales bacterium]|nr:hypothetical protein [Burkholderiales bacterium]